MSFLLPSYGACSGTIPVTWRTNLAAADPVALLGNALPSTWLYDAEPYDTLTDGQQNL